MPTPSDIIEGLSAIVKNFKWIAIAWHILFAVVVVLFFTGWRPKRKFAAFALSVPLLSVSVLAWIKNNPFSGIVFLLFAVLLAVVGLRLPDEKVQRGVPWAFGIGILMIIFGWIYPHFLESGKWFEYLYAAPTGLIPCPTLSITIGFALLANGLSSRLWSFLLAFIGLFYGLFGVIRLGVHLDVGVLIGSLALVLLAFNLNSPPSPIQT
jgi:apolipoprotein N-acyltransferase